jgi:hypothetical protein
MMGKSSTKHLEEDDDRKPNKKKKSRLDFCIGLQKDRIVQTNQLKAGGAFPCNPR